MIYHLALYLKPYWSALNVFHYVSVRAVGALLGSLACFFIGGSWFIEKSKILFRAKSRQYTPDTHRVKDDTPTMGGLFILLTVTLNVLFWCNLAEMKVWIFLLCLIGFGAIGFCDDVGKIKSRRGISARAKFAAQIMVALLVTVLWLHSGGTTSLVFPFAKHFHPDLGLFFIPWALLVLVGTSNAVNLTDGLDGLAIGSLLPNFAIFTFISYLAGHIFLALYLHIPFAGTSEMVVIGASLIGASLGFLWYNTYPAQIFMGDVGSLPLGAALGLMALMTKSELLLIIAGGLFVIEALSVILQVLSYKFRGKRLFKMAPIHHHFELLGWQESKITTRFGIISLVLCLLALITLKLR